MLLGSIFAAAPNEERLAAELATGEFAPALEAVRQITEPASRDDAAIRVIQAQIGAGAVAGAGQTAAGGLTRLPAFGAPGGANAPDFDSLVQLIQGTIAPTTWTDVGGQGAIRPFPGGVLADASGVLKRVTTTGIETDFANAREQALLAGANRDVRQSSTLRKISLHRLERAIKIRQLLGQPLDDEFWTLGGLHRVRYVFVYPKINDIVLAGPAGDWKLDHERRLVATETGRPVVRLDDLVTLLRASVGAELKFGCSITPTAAGLTRTKEFVEQSNKRPLRPGERDAWLAKLREQLGRQEIDVFGIPAESRVAQVIVEADYRMKLVGLGLEEGTLGVTSYLDSLNVRPGTKPPLDVLRWWFTMNYAALVTDADRHVFELRGQGVKVLSENELLAANGQRVHTGQSNDKNQEFAASFTKHFAALSAKHPVYAELQNIFDLALVSSLLQSEQSPLDRALVAGLFSDVETLTLPAGTVPREVDTVLNHRVVNQTQIIAAVSGGVSVEPGVLVKRTALQVDNSPRLKRDYEYGQPKADANQRWWWD
jgi:hypothetical protein